MPLTGLEPVRCCQRGIFVPLYVAIAVCPRRCSLDFPFTLDGGTVLRCAPSSLYTFRKKVLPASLGIVPHPGVSPNLTRFTRTVSQSGAQIFKSLVSADSTTAANVPPHHTPFCLRCQAKPLRRRRRRCRLVNDVLQNWGKRIRPV